jgi:hypothetical protein
LVELNIGLVVATDHSLGATDLSLYWKIDAGDSISGQEGGLGPIELFLIIVPDILPVS